MRSGRLVTPRRINLKVDLVTKATSARVVDCPRADDAQKTHLIPSNQRSTVHLLLSPFRFLTIISTNNCTYWMNTNVLLARP